MKLAIALLGDGRWHIHHADCKDFLKIAKGRRAVTIDHFDGTVEEAIASTLDNEMVSMGYGMESINILPCTTN